MQLDNTEIAGNETEVVTAPEVNDAADDTNEEVSKDEAAEADADDGAEDGGEVDKEMKTIKKALNKKNRYIDNQRQRIRTLEAEMQKLQSQASQNKTTAPEMEKFESVMDYMDAKQNYTLEQKLAEQAQQQQMTALQQQQAVLREQQAQGIAETMNELLTSNPDVAKVISQHAPVIQNMPPHIESLMLEIDNAPAATYALAKEGRLQDLYFMPPHIAAAHLVQAEIRGEQYLQQTARVVKTQAPAPIGSLKGTGKSSKSLGSMTPDEIVNKYIK